MIAGYVRVVDAVSKVAGWVSAGMIAMIAILILGEVFTRALLNDSLTFAWEYSKYFMAMAYFCGAAFALHTGGHVRVSLVSATVPPKVARAIDMIATFLAVLIVAYLAKALIEMAIDSWHDNSRSETPAATPLVVPQAAMAFGATLLALQLVARLFRLLTGRPPELVGDENQFTMDR